MDIQQQNPKESWQRCQETKPSVVILSGSLLHLLNGNTRRRTASHHPLKSIPKLSNSNNQKQRKSHFTHIPNKLFFSTKQITNKVFVESVGGSPGELEMKIFTNRNLQNKENWKKERERETYWVLIFWARSTIFFYFFNNFLIDLMRKENGGRVLFYMTLSPSHWGLGWRTLATCAEVCLDVGSRWDFDAWT